MVDVVVGYDGKPRCAWAGAGDTALGRYHDEVWGKPTYDESALFEALTLDVFEAGLSWWSYSASGTRSSESSTTSMSHASRR
jgi:Methyladenine glycosylase